MTDVKESLLRYYRQTREELLSAIEGLSDTLLTEPSLDGWSVKAAPVATGVNILRPSAP